MLKQNKPSGQRDRAMGAFGDINESRSLLGNAMRGKTVVIVTDACDLNMESAVLKYAIFGPCEAGKNSGVVSHDDFIAAKPIEADVLILRSSRIFEQRIPELLGALVAFRRGNPGCAVILCAFVGSVIRAAEPLLEAGVVNSIVSRPPNDFELLRTAAEVLERLASQ